MKTLAKSKATASLAEYVGELRREPIIVTSKGRPVAALVSLENADAETISLSTNRAFLRLIERSRKRRRSEGGLSPREMRRRLGVSKRPRKT